MKSIAFSVPIYKYKVQNWNVKKTQLLDLFHSFNPKVVGNVITSPFNIKTNILSEEIKLFEKDVGIKFYSSEVWFQKYNKNMDHPVHTHGPTGYSAVCFIEYDKDNHKPTTFISPFCNNFNGELTRYAPDVEEGDIIFFPANLLHYAPTNLSKITRIILSFNLMIEISDKKKVSYN